MSCVSGGGFTGSSFVQNIHHYMEKEGLSLHDAALKFLQENRMRKNAGKNYL
jgi:hypothetical protein